MVSFVYHIALATSDGLAQLSASYWDALMLASSDLSITLCSGTAGAGTTNLRGFRMSESRPESLTTLVGPFSPKLNLALSLSSKDATATVVLLCRVALHTSAAMNHGSLSLTMARRLREGAKAKVVREV